MYIACIEVTIIYFVSLLIRSRHACNTKLLVCLFDGVFKCFLQLSNCWQHNAVNILKNSQYLRHSADDACLKYPIKTHRKCSIHTMVGLLSGGRSSGQYYRVNVTWLTSRTLLIHTVAIYILATSHAQPELDRWNVPNRNCVRAIVEHG